MNLLFLFSDQHSRAVLGCYGDEQVATPHLDGLAADGVRFANAYCNSPICVPSRASLATGLYPHQIECWDNSAPYDGTQALSWGHELAEDGIDVTTIGKLHFQSQEADTGFADQRRAMHVRGGVGGIFNMLRGRMPPHTALRGHVTGAGSGESDYIRYDRAVTDDAVRWLHEESRQTTTPWALFASLASPHFPLVVPDEYLDAYPPESIDLPAAAMPDEWPMHPALQVHRRLADHDRPFSEKQLRRALSAYYGLVTFLDDQVGRILRALDDAGLRDETRIIYSSDHGEMRGEHGLWFKHVMYESSAGVPLIVAGPDIPAGRVVETNVSLVDVYPTVLEAVGVAPPDDGVVRPGTSLWTLARDEHHERIVFSEYHDILSDGAEFMVRDDRFKLIFYCRYPPQLFDLHDDPGETADLAGDPAYRGVVDRLTRELYAIGDPHALDAAAQASQEERLDRLGGWQAVRDQGPLQSYTAPPTE